METSGPSGNMNKSDVTSIGIYDKLWTDSININLTWICFTYDHANLLTQIN